MSEWRRLTVTHNAMEWKHNAIKTWWVWNLVADIAGGKEADGVWEHGAEENIWT